MREPPKPLPPEHRVVLDHLCRLPAKVYDFADVADALKMKRGEVESIIIDLRHQRFGAPLALFGPDGLKLRPRHAYLPADAPMRKAFPPVEHLPVDPKEHPTIIAMRKAKEEEERKKAKEAQEEAEAMRQNAIRHQYERKRKADARSKAQAEKPQKGPDGRYRTGYADPMPLEVPAAPLAPRALLAKKPPAVVEEEKPPDEAPPATYKKNKPKGAHA